MPIAGPKIKFDVHPLVFLNFAHRQAHKVAFIRTDFHNLWFLEQFRNIHQRVKVDIAVVESVVPGVAHLNEYLLSAKAEFKGDQKSASTELYVFNWLLLDFFCAPPPLDELFVWAFYDLFLGAVTRGKIVHGIGANTHNEFHVVVVVMVDSSLEFFLGGENLPLNAEFYHYF
jgi:hypothetical protein